MAAKPAADAAKPIAPTQPVAKPTVLAPPIHKHAVPSAHASKPKPKLAPLAPSKTPSLGGGQPLAPHIKEAIQNSLMVDLSSVRLHASTAAERKAQSLKARAFTFGNEIYLGHGEHPTDLKLITHEAAHVIQQQSASHVQAWSSDRGDRYEREADSAAAAVTRGEAFAVRERVESPRLQRLGISDALDYLADKANNIPGFRMFTIVLGVNPINMASTDRSAGNVLRAVVEFIPGGALITQALDKYGVFEKVGGWVQQQLDTLGMIGSSIKKALMDFLDSLGWRDIFHLGDVWDRAKRIFTDPIDRIKNFVVGLLEGIWKFVREAILKPIAALASKTAGWDLLCAVMGRNPITGEAVPRTPDTLIGGFMKLIHEDEIWNNMKKANAVSRAWAWFQGVLSGLLGFVSQIPDLFIQALKSLQWTDILDLPGGFMKVARVFGNFLGKFIGWAGGKVWDLLQIIFEVVAPSVMPYLKKVGAAFKSILKNPMGFVRTLVAAAKLGFVNFGAHFLTHLKQGLIDWLTGSLPGVYIPKALSLIEFGKFALSVLGISWAQIRGKIVKALGPNGETIMKGLETGFDIVVALVKGGPAAAWDLIKEKLTNLKDMVVDGITSFVVNTIVQKAIPKLISLFIPGAGFISAIVSIYDTIKTFMEKLSKIIAAVKAFLDSIVAIANGQIAGAAAKVESTLAGLLSLAISFLASFLGLGNIASKVLGVIEKVRASVDKALDVAVNWIVNMAKKAVSFVVGKAKGAVAGVRAAVLRFTQHVPFSANGESHEMWVDESGDPQVASAAMSLGTRIGTWKRRLPTLPPPDQAAASTLIGQCDTLNGDLRSQAATALKARTASDTAGVDAAQALIDKTQAKLQPVLSSLFKIFGDTKTAWGAGDEARIFALAETYNQVVVPMKAAGLISGTPATVTKTFTSQWNANQISQAKGWVLQMERVLLAARNVGTGRFPYLTGVEVKIPGTEIDYTTRDHDEQQNVDFDVSTEVKNWGAMRDRPAAGGGTNTIADQVLKRINTLRNQVESALHDPKYTLVVLEVKGTGFSNYPPELRDALLSEVINYRGLATSLKKRFIWKRV